MSRTRHSTLTLAASALAALSLTLGALLASPLTMTAGAQPLVPPPPASLSQSLVIQTALGTGCRTRIGIFRLNRSGPKPIGARCCGHPPETGGRRICGVVVR